MVSLLPTQLLRPTTAVRLGWEVVWRIEGRKEWGMSGEETEATCDMFHHLHVGTQAVSLTIEFGAMYPAFLIPYSLYVLGWLCLAIYALCSFPIKERLDLTTQKQDRNRNRGSPRGAPPQPL
ncbi:hypothetical protein L211DRAFT_31032 [Terfezia boudieri ATCC MYA-4762]|uniref:Uncharacterized protein n=1 Tax=Terfezia boudieri ATCC MYA-4762 TaxID=1051890 RepID=A0A3N4M393_9PEZI|nr:hypothetical protein L211DRAFT_31032 [Terfezia boudieri ATCC MYA-4762]